MTFAFEAHQRPSQSRRDDPEQNVGESQARAHKIISRQRLTRNPKLRDCPWGISAKKTGGPLSRTARNQTQFRRALAVKQIAFRQIVVEDLCFSTQRKRGEIQNLRWCPVSYCLACLNESRAYTISARSMHGHPTDGEDR